MANAPVSNLFPSNWSFSQRLLAWQDAVKEANAALQTEREMRQALFGEAFPEPKEGMNTYELGNGYKLKGDYKFNYSLTNGKGETKAFIMHLQSIGGEVAFIGERLVKWKPELSITEYRKLPTNVSQMLMKAEILTIKPGLPALEIESPKGKVVK